MIVALNGVFPGVSDVAFLKMANIIGKTVNKTVDCLPSQLEILAGSKIIKAST